MISKNKLENVSKIKLLIFDVDQTLTIYNTMETICETALNHFGLKYEDKIFKTSLKSFEETLLKAAEGIPLTTSSLINSFEEHMPFLKENKVEEKLFVEKILNLEREFVKKASNIDKVLESLGEQYRIVCLTNWFEKIATEKLIATGLYKYISKIYTCETNHAKPHENSYAHVLKKEKFSNFEALMIGDSKADVQSSVYGIQSILVDYDNNKADDIKDMASCVITEPMDLLEILNKNL